MEVCPLPVLSWSEAVVGAQVADVSSTGSSPLFCLFSSLLFKNYRF